MRASCSVCAGVGPRLETKGELAVNSACAFRLLPMTSRLTRATLLDAATCLASKDPDLGRILDLFGPPPLWARPAGYATLVRIILEQQVSLASGRSAFARLTDGANQVEPEQILRLGPERVRARGLTRQKTRYIVELARAVQNEQIDLRSIGRMEDEQARNALMVAPGIGPWTANIYLLMALRRKDVWPVADLALRNALQQLRGMQRTPTDAALEKIAQRWRPHRSVAARMLWHYYLCSRRGNRA